MENSLRVNSQYLQNILVKSDKCFVCGECIPKCDKTRHMNREA